MTRTLPTRCPARIAGSNRLVWITARILLKVSGGSCERSNSSCATSPRRVIQTRTTTLGGSPTERGASTVHVASGTAGWSTSLVSKNVSSSRMAGGREDSRAASAETWIEGWIASAGALSASVGASAGMMGACAGAWAMDTAITRTATRSTPAGADSSGEPGIRNAAAPRCRTADAVNATRSALRGITCAFRSLLPTFSSRVGRSGVNGGVAGI